MVFNEKLGVIIHDCITSHILIKFIDDSKNVLPSYKILLNDQM